VEAEQRGGRPGRLDSANPDKVSTIVDFIDKNAKKKPVLFSEILGGAYVVQKGKKQNISNLLDEAVVTNESHLVHNDRSANKIERDIELLKLISVDDLRISVDSQEVLTVTREYTESREKKEFDFWILKEEVQNAGIQSSGEYEDTAKANGWPSNSTLRKNENWKGWDDFLGRTPFEFFNLKKDVISKGVKTSGDYAQMRKDYGWPTVSSLQGKLEWKGWDDFLGRVEKKTYTLADLKSLILELNIKTRNEYERIAPIRKLPSKKGLIKLPGWKGWDDFLGREEKISSFEELQAVVRKSGILNSKDYDSLAPLNNWPAAATVRKNEKWKGWDDFLGREVKVEKFNFDKIRQEVIDAKIKSSTEYFECASSQGWPSDFLLRNSPHWTNWDDFLERKPFNFDNLKKDVRSLGIKSSHVYKDMSPVNGWPNETYLRLRPEWKGWDDFLGREEKKLYSFSELKQEVTKHGIYSSKEYGNKSAQLGLPSMKTLKKFPEWKGWDDFFGRF
jgi:hypothetical protein